MKLQLGILIDICLLSLVCVFLLLAEEFIPSCVSWQLQCSSVSWCQQIQRTHRKWGPKQCMLGPCPQQCWE